MKGRLAFVVAAAAPLLCGVAALLPAAHASRTAAPAPRFPVARPAAWPLWAHQQARAVAAPAPQHDVETHALAAGGEKLDLHGLRGIGGQHAAVSAAPSERSQRQLTLLFRPQAASPGVPVPPPRLG